MQIPTTESHLEEAIATLAQPMQEQNTSDQKDESKVGNPEAVERDRQY